MGCNCGNKAGKASKTYVVTDKNGAKKSYRTEVEAVAAAKRTGGTYKSA